MPDHACESQHQNGSGSGDRMPPTGSPGPWDSKTVLGEARGSRAPARAYAIAAGATLVMAWLTCAPALTDWDSWNYTSEAIRARPSILCLGRWWFIVMMRWAYQAAAPFGIDPVHGFVPMRVAVAILTAGAVVAVMHWAYLLTGRRRAAVWAGGIAVASPSLAAYCSAVMTEGPTLLFLALALVGWEKAIRGDGWHGHASFARPCSDRCDEGGHAHANSSVGMAPDSSVPRSHGPTVSRSHGPTVSRSHGPTVSRSHGLTVSRSHGPTVRRLFTPAAWAMLAGMSFGVAVDMREPVALLCVWPVISCFTDRPVGRWRLLALAGVGAIATLALGVMMTWVWRPEQDPLAALLEWVDYMGKERVLSRVNPLANAGFFLMHYATASPVAVLALLGLLVVRAGRGRRADGGKGVVLPRRVIWLGVSTIPFALSTWYNPDLSFNFRLLLPMAWMLAPLGGVAVEATLEGMKTAKRRAAIGAGATPRIGSPSGEGARRVRWRQAALLFPCLLLVAGAFAARLIPHLGWAAYQDRLFRELQELPDNAVIIAGPGSPSAKYLRQLAVRPRWMVILTDYDFAGKFDPGFWTGANLAAGIERQIRRGKRAFVNAAPRGWTRAADYNPEWEAVQDLLRRFPTRPAAGGFVELLRGSSPVALMGSGFTLASRRDTLRASPGRNPPASRAKGSLR